MKDIYMQQFASTTLIMFAWLFGTFSALRADVILKVQDAQIAAGGFGFVDLVAYSNGTNTLAISNYKLEITPLNVINGGILEFQPSLNDVASPKQTNSQQSQSNYIFAGDTDVNNFSASRQDPNRTQFIGGDATGSTSDVTLPNSTGPNDFYLVARIGLQHITLNPETSAGTFRVSLIEDSNTTFLADSGANFVNIAPVSYTPTNAAVITVISAVPEPSTCVLASLAMLGIGVRRWRSRVSRNASMSTRSCRR